MVGGDIVHVLDRYQLAVGHVEKVAASGDLAEQVPGGAVGTVVGDIAMGGAVVDRHTAVVGNGEDIEQLFQVGARAGHMHQILPEFPSPRRTSSKNVGFNAASIRLHAMLALPGCCSSRLIASRRTNARFSAP